MMKHWNRFVRRISPIVAAGVLLQATGCDLSVTGLLSSIGATLIQSFVFGAFNLA